MLSDSPNLILVKSIVAVYIERTLPEENGKLYTVIDKAIEHIRMPADTMGDGSEGEIAHALRTTLDWLRTLKEDMLVSKVDLVERVRMNCTFNSEYVDSLDRQLVLEDDDHINSQRVKTIVSELQHALRETEFSQLIKKANRTVNFGKETFDIKSFLSEFQDDLREFESEGNEEKAGCHGKLSTEDLSSVVDAMKSTVELNSEQGLLKTGLKGLNRLLNGGYSRGEQFNYGALTHNYKSGMLLDHCRWFCLHNKPNLIDKKKKPMVLRLSFENKIEQDLPLIYRSLWEAEHQKKMDLATIDAQEAAQYVLDKMSSNGFTFEMLCYDPNVVDVWDVVDILQAYEAKGYEVHAIIVDYPELITKKNSGKQRRQDEVITYTFEVLRNHCFPRGITQITAHQLSTEAQKIAREEPRSFANKVATGSYYMNVQSLATKLDGEAILHLHRIGDDTYLECVRGKHRRGDRTPIKHRRFFYKFGEFGGINDDMATENSEGNALYSLAGVETGEIIEPGSTGGQALSQNDW